MTEPIKRSVKYDHDEDKLVQHSVQDISPMLELNKKEYNKDYMHGSVDTPELGMRKVASIPLVIIEKWKHELGVDIMNKEHWPKIKRLLNDPENRFFRTKKGHL